VIVVLHLGQALHEILLRNALKLALRYLPIGLNDGTRLALQRGVLVTPERWQRVKSGPETLAPQLACFSDEYDEHAQNVISQMTFYCRREAGLLPRSLKIPGRADVFGEKEIARFLWKFERKRAFHRASL
jgi:hypothetical protein